MVFGEDYPYQIAPSLCLTGSLVCRPSYKRNIEIKKLQCIIGQKKIYVNDFLVTFTEATLEF